MNTKTTMLGLAALALVGGFLVFYDPQPVSAPVPSNTDVFGASQKWESKVDDQAAVTITVTPSDISPNSQEWRFHVVMDTHSVELDQDMTRIAVLTDESGKEYKPLRWEGAPPGGHHREGVLVFAVIEPVPQAVELNVKDIDGIPERSFKWNTNESI